ncbi:MAG: cytochrome b, partial [Caulobacteraceae bacterium]
LAARAVEYGFYVLLLVQPATGMADTLFRGRPFALFLWRVPRLIGHDKAVSRMFNHLHVIGAWTLMALIGLHTLAALAHRYLARDRVMQSMLPARRRCRPG